ncbi:hypothetical protein [Streptomyces sp. NPDC126499]|uniref:hypothetical protein n=1 Tax=Streptomyces sp. NPDC126499 TaxID=3155314 RepID=UPI00332604B6
MSGSGGGGALYALVVGTGMTGFGLVLATDFRGAARRLRESSLRSAPSGGPFWRRRPGVGFVRLLGAAFALLGPVILALGAVQAARGDVLVGDSPRLPVPFLLFLLLAVAVGMGNEWRRNGRLRREWADGGRGQRAASVVISGSFAGFAAGLGLGLQLLWLLSWALGAGAGLFLLVAGRTGR